jgi:spermidine synthase
MIIHPEIEDLRLVSRGKAVRLKAPEGTFSFYHPNKLFTSLGWDAQSASVFLAKKKVKSILILGLGGGTVARQCRNLFPDAEIWGIEIDQWVLNVAYDYFELDSININTIVMPGQEYLKQIRRRFDVIIDDMWLPLFESPKPVLIEKGWARTVRTGLNPGGVYAVNLYNIENNPTEVKLALEQLKPEFSDFREIRPGSGQTTVIAVGFDLLTADAARNKIRSLPETFANALNHVQFLDL